MIRVIGIDPGLRNLGWGVIDVSGSRIAHVANGICHSEGDDLGARLLSLHGQLTRVLTMWQPQAAAVEQTFVNKDGAGTLKLGQARGIAMLVPAQFGLTVGEYAPNKVKKTVVGVGHADKGQVAHMVKMQMPPMRWPSRSVTRITAGPAPSRRRWRGRAHDRQTLGPH